MTKKLSIKQQSIVNVYEATKARCRLLYDICDLPVVNFSGGKDSTALLYCMIEVAEELGRLPVKTRFVDLEIQTPDTIRFVKKMFDNKKYVNMMWYASAMRERNASSLQSPFWYPWHPLEKHLWVRDMPEWACEPPAGYEFTYEDTGKHFQALGVGNSPNLQQMLDLAYYEDVNRGLFVKNLIGIRNSESQTRMMAFWNAKEGESWIGGDGDRCYPVYDWSAEDTWRLIKMYEAEKPDFYVGYNNEYNMANRTSQYKKYSKQRVGTPVGEESMRGITYYREEYPEMWQGMLDRMEGMASAWRYTNSEVFSIGKVTLPDTLDSYKDYLNMLLNLLNPSIRKLTKERLQWCIRRHWKQTNDDIPEDHYHPMTGMSWSFFCKIAIRGDYRDRTTRRSLNQAKQSRTQLNMSRDETIRKYGTEEYKRSYQFGTVDGTRKPKAEQLQPE